MRCDSYSRHTGGTLIYVIEPLKFVIHENKNYDNNTWCLSIDIKSKELKGTYTVIYHSPSTSDSIFCDILEQIFCNNVNLLKSCIVLGDFNIDMSKQNTYSKKLQHIIEHHGLKQIVNFYTRVTRTSSTIIDLVITNSENIACKCLPNEIITDHETLSIKIVSSNTCLQHTQEYTSWDNYNKDRLISILQGVQWDTFYHLPLDNKLSTLCEILSTAVSQLVSKKNIKKIKTPGLMQN